MIKSALTRRRRRPPAGPAQAAPPPDTVITRLLKMNQGETDLAAAAGLLEQAQPDDYIPDYDRRRQTPEELKQARQAVAIERYRLESRCQAPVERQIRDCHA